MNIVVYLGANFAKDERYNRMALQLGEWIGSHGHTLIYGGSKTGLMGLLAEGAVSKGGKVIGVEPDFFVRQVLQHEGITQLIVTKTMSERRSKMIELGELFIAFPGGVGTLDEISEVMALRSLGLIGKKSCILFNFMHYYDALRAQIEKMLSEGFLSRERLEDIHFADSFDELTGLVEEAAKSIGLSGSKQHNQKVLGKSGASQDTDGCGGQEDSEKEESRPMGSRADLTDETLRRMREQR